MTDLLVPITPCRYERTSFFQTIDSLVKTSELKIIIGDRHENLGRYPYDEILNRINDNRTDDFLVEIVPDTFAIRSSMITEINSVRRVRDNMYEIIIRNKRYHMFYGDIELVVSNINQANKILSQGSVEDDYDSEIECAQRQTPPEQPSKKRLRLVDGNYVAT